MEPTTMSGMYPNLEPTTMSGMYPNLEPTTMSAGIQIENALWSPVQRSPFYWSVLRVLLVFNSAEACQYY